MSLPAHTRKSLMSQLLVLTGEREVTRDVVEAAAWQTVGWNTDPAVVSRLMMVVDAFADNRVHRALLAAHGEVIPRVIAEEPASPVRAALADMTIQPRQRVLQQAPRTVLSASPPVCRLSSVPFQRLDEPEEPEEPNETVDAESLISHGDAISLAASPTSLDEVRVCTGCEMPKPIHEFWKNKRGPGGREWRCRTCKAKAENDRVKRNAKRQAADAAAAVKAEAESGSQPA
jgi:hypothetical protein